MLSLITMIKIELQLIQIWNMVNVCNWFVFFFHFRREANHLRLMSFSFCISILFMAPRLILCRHWDTSEIRKSCSSTAYQIQLSRAIGKRLPATARLFKYVPRSHSRSSGHFDRRESHYFTKCKSFIKWTRTVQNHLPSIYPIQ